MQEEWSVHDLGTLSGRIWVFGGVYSNLQALTAFRALADAEGIPPGQVLCTGDVVGYCAHPEEVVQHLREWGIQSIAGNVEIQLREGETDCGCNFDGGSRCDLFSRNWYPYAMERVSEASLDWMRQLPHHLAFRSGGLDFRILHGSARAVAGYVFASTSWEEKASQLRDLQADIIIGGHCGLPFASQKEQKYWLNAGVIGMPANDGTTRVWFLELEVKEGKLKYQHRSFEYDHIAAAKAMATEGLPTQYAQTLSTGIWNNCEILPEEETALQGVRLAL